MIARALFVEEKKLRVFDMDDTLIKTNSYVLVIKPSGAKLKLTPGEYAKYTPLPDDIMDYSEFRSLQNPQIIKTYFKVLRRVASKGKDTYILTARAAYQPIHNFIRDSGILGVKVVALADGNPEKKADWIEKKVKDEGFDDIYFIDDSEKNIEAVKKRLSKYPRVKSRLQLAKSYL